MAKLIGRYVKIHVKNSCYTVSGKIKEIEDNFIFFDHACIPIPSIIFIEFPKQQDQNNVVE